MNEPLHKIIISGTGRAGTTFLVRLLTELGLDTGYAGDSWKKDFHSHCMAGLEQDLFDPAAPYVVKSPALCTTLAPALASGQIHVDHAIIPVRELSAAASSRIRVGGTDGNVPGGLWMTDRPEGQAAALATVFHQLVHTLVAYDVPLTLLQFPRCVKDPAYAFAKLRPVLGSVDWETFDAAFGRVADPSLVHDFTQAGTSQNGEAGREFLRKRRRQHRRRVVRRALGWSLGAVVIGLLLYQKFGLPRS